MPTQSGRIIRTEFASAIAQIASERKIDVDSIYQAIEHALVSAFRKQYGLEDEFYYFAKLDHENGQSQIFKAPIIERDEETEEILSWDEKKAEEVTPDNFGRIAAQTAKQVILQKIRESEREHILAAYNDKIGEIVTAQILRMDRGRVILDLGRGQGIMPPEEQMRGEFYRINSRIVVLIKGIEETGRGRQVIVSRADKRLVEKLFYREVPEISSGSVVIALIAREAGVRTKLAVKATQDGVDPVGSCVGQRGVRVQEVIRELNNEKVDIIPYNDDDKLLLLAALAPAEGLKIDLDEKKRLATVTAPDDQLSLVIGRGGQNVRLASKLTGWKITVQSASGQVKSQVTGEEEYEIDTFDLSQETRDKLVSYKLTTLSDLARFKQKWLEFEEVNQADRANLLKRIEVFEKEFEERSQSASKL